MKISAFPIVCSKEDITRDGRVYGGLLGRLFLLNRKPTSIRLFYIEFKVITLGIEHPPSLIDRWVFGKKTPRFQTMPVIADGTCGATAWADSLPPIVEVEADPQSIQRSDFSDEELVRRAKKTALRILRRHVGGFPMIEFSSIESVFRPYWIVFYGKLEENRKVRYIPVPADGCRSHRTF